jgi:hypothetical protein
LGFADAVAGNAGTFSMGNSYNSQPLPVPSPGNNGYQQVVNELRLLRQENAQPKQMKLNAKPGAVSFWVDSDRQARANF